MIEHINTIAQSWWSWMWPMFWQVCVLVVFIGAVDFLLRRRIWPQVRYALWLLVLVKLILPPTFSLSTSIVSQVRMLAGRTAVQLSDTDMPAVVPTVRTSTKITPLDTGGSIKPAPDRDGMMSNKAAEPAGRVFSTGVAASVGRVGLHWKVCAMAVWLAGVIILGLWAAVRFRKLRQLHSVKFSDADLPEWFGTLFTNTAKKLGLRKLPGIALSQNIASPAVFGTFRPVLVLPAAAIHRLSQKRTEHILLHELAHIKRGDLLVNAFYMLLQIVYWFNPLLWLLRRRLQHLRELCCDATVAGILREKTTDYRETILQNAKWLLTGPVKSGIGLLGLVEDSHNLLVRLNWLEKKTWKYRSLRIVTVCAVIALMLVCVLPMAKANNADVLSVAADGSAKYSSIQKAIDAAGAGAVIRIGPGMYEERLKIDKSLTLAGAGWDKTTIMTANAGAGVVEEAMRTLQVRMQEAKTDDQRNEISAKFKAEFKEKYGRPTLFVSDTEGVVIRDLKLTLPGERLEGRSMPVPILEFSNAKTSVSKCVVIGTPGDGIHILNGSDVEIRDSLVAAVWGTGIIVGERQGASSGVRLLDSELRNCHYAGICIRKGNDSARVERCRISGAVWHGIRYDDCSPTIVGNWIFGNARSGIYASGQTSATVRQNLFYANEMGGMSCWFQNRDTIEGNTFAGNKQVGLSILGASEPVVQKNIFFSESNGIVCGDIGSDSAFTRSDGIVTMDKNLFWNNEHMVARRRAKTADSESTTEEIALDKQAGNLEMDPMFADAAVRNFSLMSNSPARRLGIGVAEPIGFESPWPIQPEEAAIIPDGPTRDYRKWKMPPKTASPVQKTDTGTTTVEMKDGLHIKAFIDGKDTIKIKGVELWYEHHDWDLPGKWWDRAGNIKHDEPTYINGTAWKPEWQERVSKPYRLEQAVPLREANNLIKLAKIAGRGSVTITEMPQQANDYTLSILLDDSRYNKAQWYEFVIQWGSSDSQKQGLNLSSAEESDGIEAVKPMSTAKNDLQQMIDSAQAGTTVIVPKGVYTEPVTITKPLVLKGESRNECIFEVTSNQPAISVDAKDKGGVIIEAITIKWQLATSERTEYPFAVGIKNTVADIKNCCFLPLGNFKRCPVAINSMGFSELNIDTCRFEGFEYTVCFGQDSKGVIRNSLVIDSGHQGISLYSGATAEITGNVVTGSRFHAVRSTGGTLNMKDNLIINNANRGVYLGNRSARGTIANNVIIGNGTGIGGFARSNVKVVNNIIADSSYAGIGMRDSCSLSIRNNIFRGNERGWILFKEGSGNDNTVYKNTFWRNKVDAENMDKTADSIMADPDFADAENGDFSLKPGPALEQKQGLTDLEIFKMLWKRWQNRVDRNEPFTEAIPITLSAQKAYMKVEVEPAEQEGQAPGSVVGSGYAWQRTDRYVSPSPENFFPDDPDGGKRLDALFNAVDKDRRPDEEILTTVRQGFRRTRKHRTLILAWIGNRYIWGKQTQNPEAIEIMYHAVPMERHYAIYFGLSVVLSKTPNILRTLVDICMQGEEVGRITWGIGSQRDELISYIEPYMEHKESKKREMAEILLKHFNGELDFEQWKRQKILEQKRAQYGGKLPQFREQLLKGDSKTREQILRLFWSQGLGELMDDSFLEAFQTAAEDSNPGVRRYVAKIAGNRWVWSGDGNLEAIELMLKLSADEDRDVRYNAVYHGLSTIRNKSEVVIRRLIELALADHENNLYGRIVWGLREPARTDSELLKQILFEQFERAKSDWHHKASVYLLYKDALEKEPPGSWHLQEVTERYHEDIFTISFSAKESFQPENADALWEEFSKNLPDSIDAQRLPNIYRRDQRVVFVKVRGKGAGDAVKEIIQNNPNLRLGQVGPLPIQMQLFFEEMSDK